MSAPRRYTKRPEFPNLEKYVWEGLNNPGRTISSIEKEEGKHLDNPMHEETRNAPIWHSKAELDRFVAGELNLNLEDYGSDKSSNRLYKYIAKEVANLRRAGVLVDWRTIESRDTGMGVWRLDKTKLDNFVLRRAKKEIKNKNYHSAGSACVVYVRQKQVAFRAELLLEYGKCALCKFRIPEYMIGAHIVPYSVMREQEPHNAMNPKNGLLLCRFCDVAFENGSITIDADFGITISEHLSESKEPIVKTWLEPILPELHIKAGARYPPDPRYLEWKKKLLSKNGQV